MPANNIMLLDSLIILLLITITYFTHTVSTQGIITQDQDLLYAEIGNNLTVECTVHGKASDFGSKIFWAVDLARDGSFAIFSADYTVNPTLANKYEVISAGANLTNYHLLIKQYTTAEEGYYRCQFGNETITDVQTSVPADPPEIKEIENENNRVKYSCIAVSGNPWPTSCIWDVRPPYKGDNLTTSYNVSNPGGSVVEEISLELMDLPQHRETGVQKAYCTCIQLDKTIESGINLPASNRGGSVCQCDLYVGITVVVVINLVVAVAIFIYIIVIQCCIGSIKIDVQLDGINDASNDSDDSKQHCKCYKHGCKTKLIKNCCYCGETRHDIHEKHLKKEHVCKKQKPYKKCHYEEGPVDITFLYSIINRVILVVVIIVIVVDIILLIIENIVVCSDDTCSGEVAVLVVGCVMWIVTIVIIIYLILLMKKAKDANKTEPHPKDDQQDYTKSTQRRPSTAKEEKVNMTDKSTPRSSPRKSKHSPSHDREHNGDTSQGRNDPYHDDFSNSQGTKQIKVENTNSNQPTVTRPVKLPPLKSTGEKRV